MGQKHYGTWALVAGAAEGLGEAFSRLLAGSGMNLVMVDFNRLSMEKLAASLRAGDGVSIQTLELDLSAPDAWQRCMEKVAEYDCRLLVYNAAFSHVTGFLSHSHEDLDRFVTVNARTEIHLVHAFAERLRGEKKPGGILLMSSLSGVVAPPLVAPYAATKGFTNKLAESLHAEFRPLGIRISACTAGITSTPKFWESRPVFGFFRPAIMEGPAVASFALRNLGRRAVITPGWQNRLSYFLLTRLLPAPLSLKIVSGAMRKMYPSGSTGQ
jgi:hypothetical protein